jgi:hypothetical protein
MGWFKQKILSYLNYLYKTIEFLLCLGRIYNFFTFIYQFVVNKC